MATYSQVSQNKRGRNEYWNGGLALPDAKRPVSRTLLYDSDLMSLLDKIDDMDTNDSKSEGTYVVDETEGQKRLNMVIKSIKEEIGLKLHAYNNIESTDENGSYDQMGSIKEGELTEWYSEPTSSVYEMGVFKDYFDVGAEHGFLADYVSSYESGIIINYVSGDGDLIANIMHYSDAVYGYAETTEDFYVSLWEDDISQFNENSIIRNDSASPQQDENGMGPSFMKTYSETRM